MVSVQMFKTGYSTNGMKFYKLLITNTILLMPVVRRFWQDYNQLVIRYNYPAGFNKCSHL